jgi:hypothetical protein
MELKHFLAAGYLARFDWGCSAGQHCGWTIIEAENATEARMVVPSLLRSKACVIELQKFTQDDIAREEEQHRKEA